jgi:hypothetical protein
VRVPVTVIAVLTLALASAACAPAQNRDTIQAAVAQDDADATPSLSPPGLGNNGMLPTPFTAERIRAEWVEGFRLEQLDRERPSPAAAD